MNNAVTADPTIIRRDAALSYVRRGFVVIPLHDVVSRETPGVCSCRAGAECRDAGKHPRITGWRELRTPDETKIVEWWRRWPNANIGLVTGPASGFWCLDVDPKNGGDAALAEIDPTRSLGQPDVRTPSGGSHYLFELPGDFLVTDRRGKLPKGIDVRGDGGQIVAPPSTRGDGEYVAVREGLDLRKPPEWLLDLIRPVGVVSRETPPDDADRIDAGEVAATVEVSDVALSAYVRGAVEAEVQRVLDAGEGDRNNALNTAAFSLATMVPHGAITEDAIRDALALAAEAIGLGSHEIAKTLDSAITAGFRKPRAPWPPVLSPLGSEGVWLDVEPGTSRAAGGQPTRPLGPKTDDIRMLPWNDVGNGERIAERCRHVLKWSAERGKWLIFDGRRWIFSDEAGRRLVQIMLAQLPAVEGPLYDDTPKTDDNDKALPSDREAFEKWAGGQLMTGRVNSAMTEAKAHPALQVKVSELDSRPMLLNVANGTIDLVTGEIRPHSPEDFLTQCSPVVYDPSATSEAWDAFIREVQPDENERRSLQVFAGYTLTGDISERAMAVHYGEGANGKSVFIDVLMRTLGDMGQAVPRDTFTAKSGERHPTDVARMLGKRLLQTVEPKTGTGLDEELIKSLTGGDVVTARFMRSDFFDFIPTGKVHYVTNHMPRVSDGMAIWSRIRLFTWGVTIPEERRVRNLSSILFRDESAGILRWLIEGCLMWQREGLVQTDRQRAEIASYREDEDDFGFFIAARLQDAPGSFTPNAELFAAYRGFCQEQGLYVLDSRVFGRKLAERGYARGKRSRGSVRGFCDVRVRPVGVADPYGVDPGDDA